MPTLITQLTLQDILEGEKASNVSFQSCQDRRLYPSEPAFDRLGNEKNPNRVPPRIGPGSYNVGEVTDFAEVLKMRPGKSESALGVGISGRTGPFRLPLVSREQIANPSPAEYQEDVTRLRRSQSSYKPFGSASDRKSVLEQASRGPPPGAHDTHLNTGKSAEIQRDCSFGGDQYLRVPLRTTKENGMRKTFSAQDLKKFRSREAYLSLYWTK